MTSVQEVIWVFFVAVLVIAKCNLRLVMCVCVCACVHVYVHVYLCVCVCALVRTDYPHAFPHQSLSTRLPPSQSLIN